MGSATGAYLNNKTEYSWHLCLDDEHIVGGLGIKIL